MERQGAANHFRGEEGREAHSTGRRGVGKMADVKEAAKPKKKYSTPWRPPNIMRAKPKPGMAQRWLSKERFRGDGSRVGDWEIDRGKHPELAKRMEIGRASRR